LQLHVKRSRRYFDVFKCMLAGAIWSPPPFLFAA